MAALMRAPRRRSMTCCQGRTLIRRFVMSSTRRKRKTTARPFEHQLRQAAEIEAGLRSGWKLDRAHPGLLVWTTVWAAV
jgi:hypothetical protein